MTKKIIKIMVLSLFLTNFFGCNGNSEYYTNTVSPGVDEPIVDAPTDGNTDSGDPVEGENPPDVGDNGEKMASNVIARFFYNGNVVNLKKDYTIEAYKTAENYCLSADGKTEIIDGSIYYDGDLVTTLQIKAKEIFTLDGKDFYITGIKGDLYKNNQIIATRKYPHIDCFANEAGYSDGQYFYYFTGEKTNFGITKRCKDAVVHFESIGGGYSNLYMLKNKRFEFITIIYKYDFYELDFILYKDKLHNVRGSVIDTKGADHLIPKFKQTFEHGRPWGEYCPGNVWLKYVNDPYRYNAFGVGNVFFDYAYIIGEKDGVVYSLNTRTGNLSKWMIESDTEEQSVNLCSGTKENKNVYPYDRGSNYDVYIAVAPIMVGDYIFYCDGVALIKYDYKLNKKEKIADATDFKGWLL